MTSNYAGARKNNPAHNGISERVRAEIAKKPSTVTDVAYRLGEPADKVKSCVNQLCQKGGGIAAVPWSSMRARVYATIEWIRAEEDKRRHGRRRPSSGSGQIAGPMTIGRGYRWGGFVG